jgi:hypothetical protein
MFSSSLRHGMTTDTRSATAWSGGVSDDGVGMCSTVLIGEDGLLQTTP